jgi:hypothetical protein
MASTNSSYPRPRSPQARRRGMALTPELVARCLRVEPDPGPNPDYTPLTDTERADIAEGLLRERPRGTFGSSGMVR